MPLLVLELPFLCQVLKDVFSWSREVDFSSIHHSGLELRCSKQPDHIPKVGFTDRPTSNLATSLSFKAKSPAATDSFDLKLEKLYIRNTHHACAALAARFRGRCIERWNNLLFLGLMHDGSVLQMASHNRHNHRLSCRHFDSMVLCEMSMLRRRMLLRMPIVLQ